MKIEDAIKRYESWAEDDRIDALIRKEHRQMADWLKELKVDRPQGEWIDKGWRGDWQFETDGRGNCWKEYECSECGFHNKGGKSNYCPNCGADMREREDK